MPDFWEYFRGKPEDTWPVASVHLDKGFKSPEHYTIRLTVGSSTMKIDRSTAEDILKAVIEAEERWEALQDG